MIAPAARGTHSVTLATGVTLEYVVQGDPDGVPVLFLHGYSDSLVSYALALSHLPGSIRAITVTQRGHGDSSRPARGYAMADFAADAIGALNALGIERAVIAGHSMGSIIATRIAAEQPERVLGLVLIGAFYDQLGRRSDMLEMHEVVQALTDPVDEEFVREFQMSTIGQHVPQEFIEAIIAESLKLPACVWQSAFTGLLQDDLSSRLGAIAAPTLILWGDQDQFCSGHEQRSLLAAIRQSHLIVYPGTGHAIHWEQPKRFADDVATFVSLLAR